MAYFLGKGTTTPSGSFTANPTSVYNPPEGDPNAPTGGEETTNCEAKCAQYKGNPPLWARCMSTCTGSPSPRPAPSPTPSPTPVGGCPAGAPGTPVSNHPECACGDEWNTPTTSCPPGYVFQSKLIGGKAVEGMVGRCICEALTHGGGPSTAGKLGEYKYPSGMSDLMTLLLGRGKELMGMPLGYSQEAMDKMFGLGFENVRAGERGVREQLLNMLSSQGMLGTGTAVDKVNENAWNTEKGITDLARQLFVSNEEKKKADLLDYTGAAQNILGGGAMSYENLLESVNAARRGEGNTALMLLLQLLGTFGG